MKTKQRYDEAFKREALRLLSSSGKSARQLEQDLGITPGLLYKWKARYQIDAVQNVLRPSERHDLEAENRRLKRELEIVRQERELLKKVLRICWEDAK